MNLERSKRTMQRLSGKDQAAVEDVLDVLYDVCQDVKEGCGSSVEKLPCLDESELYRRLPWMARTVLKICRQNEDRISDAGRKAHLKELGDEVEKYSLQLDCGAIQLKEVLEKRKAAADELSGKQEELERIRTETEKIHEQARQAGETLHQARLKLEAEKEQRQKELADSEDGLHILEKEREEIQSLLEGEEALKVQLQSDRIRQEIQDMTERTERLAGLRKKLASEFLSEGRENDDAGALMVTRSFDEGLEKIRRELTQYSILLRNYADLLSDA